MFRGVKGKGGSEDGFGVEEGYKATAAESTENGRHIQSGQAGFRRRRTAVAFSTALCARFKSVSANSKCSE